MSDSDVYTRWALLGTGVSGGRLSARFYQSQHTGIRDRILFFTTGSETTATSITDVNNNLGLDDAEDFIEQHHFNIESADTNPYYQDSISWAEPMSQALRRVDNTDVFLHVAGAGTPAAGHIPCLSYLIDNHNQSSISENIFPEWLGCCTFGGLLAWPFKHEREKDHFNAMAALAQSSKWMDWTIVVANEKIRTAGMPGKEPYSRINDRIIRLIELVITASRTPERILHPDHLKSLTQSVGTHVLIPGLASEDPESIDGLGPLFDRAADQMFAPVDIATASQVFAIIEIPNTAFGTLPWTALNIKQTFAAWREDYSITEPSTITISPTDENTITAGLLVGGVDMAATFRESKINYRRHKLLSDDEMPEEFLTSIDEALTDHIGLEI